MSDEDGAATDGSGKAASGNVNRKDKGLGKLFSISFQRALRSLTPALPATVLEVGCGEGKELQALLARKGAAPRLVVGLDLDDEHILELEWRKLPTPTMRASADRLPFPDDSFDLVLALEMLEHVPDPDLVLAEIARVARGPVVISVPWEPVWRMSNAVRLEYLGDPDHKAVDRRNRPKLGAQGQIRAARQRHAKDPQRFWTELGNTPGHIQHFSRKGVQAAIGRHLDIVEVRRPLPWTMVLAQAR